MGVDRARRTRPEPQITELRPPLVISELARNGCVIDILADTGEKLRFLPVWGGWGAFHLRRNGELVLNQPSGRKRMYLLSPETIATGEKLTYSAMGVRKTVTIRVLDVTEKNGRKRYP